MLKQLHTDTTNRRHTSLVNVVMGFLAGNDEFCTICLDGAIIAKEGTAEKSPRAVLQSFKESSELLNTWRIETEQLFPKRPELVESIPQPSSMNITRMLDGMISHDNCTTVHA
jgi:hypothetical protein